MTCSIWTDNDGSPHHTKRKIGDRCMFVMFTTNVVCHTQPRALGHLLRDSISPFLDWSLSLFPFVVLYG